MKKRQRYRLLVDLPANGSVRFVPKGSTLTWSKENEAYYFDHEQEGESGYGFWYFDPEDLRDTRFFAPIPV